MKYYIIAGEASGDLHGSNLIKSIKEKDPQAEIRCWGGDLMEAAGAEVVKHFRELAFMGFAEVIMNLKTILGNIKECKKDIENYQPDAVVLIDYPGFNLRIAEFVKKLEIKVYYYISPQIWAWKKSRVHKIAKFTDMVFTILPFEKEFYAKYGYEVHYVGHPLLDAIDNRDTSAEKKAGLRKEFALTEKPIIAILPGSRKQEIGVMLPIMLKQIQNFPEHQFVIAAAPSFDLSYFEPFTAEYPSLKIVSNRTYDLLQISAAALVTSGTATLETALFRVPEVVCYKGNVISYQIAKRIVDIKYISLVNLILDEEVVTELIQGNLNEKLLKTELGKLLGNTPERQKMMDKFETLINTLGSGGASAKTAELLIEDLKNYA
ncbi:MAG: lipid-A-disaccharide synthase [Flavobacteriales bacterium]|nr:lipid-A-disaccharide synthase [Flavobacteriales bacterium]